MNQIEQFDWLWTVIMPLVFVIVFIVIPLVLNRYFEIPFFVTVRDMLLVSMFVAVIFLTVNLVLTIPTKESIVEEFKSELEVAKQTTPYSETEIDDIRLLSKEQQEKDEVKNEVYLFNPIEEDLETAYVEIAFQDKLEQTIYRFPAYVQYADVNKAKMRYQLIGNTVYNAVVTLPIEAGESLE